PPVTEGLGVSAAPDLGDRGHPPLERLPLGGEPLLRLPHPLREVADLVDLHPLEAHRFPGSRPTPEPRCSAAHPPARGRGRRPPPRLPSARLRARRTRSGP